MRNFPSLYAFDLCGVFLSTAFQAAILGASAAEPTRGLPEAFPLAFMLANFYAGYKTFWLLPVKVRRPSLPLAFALHSLHH